MQKIASKDSVLQAAYLCYVDLATWLTEEAALCEQEEEEGQDVDVTDFVRGMEDNIAQCAEVLRPQFPEGVTVQDVLDVETHGERMWERYLTAKSWVCGTALPILASKVSPNMPCPPVPDMECAVLSDLRAAHRWEVSRQRRGITFAANGGRGGKGRSNATPLLVRTNTNSNTGSASSTSTVADDVTTKPVIAAAARCTKTDKLADRWEPVYWLAFTHCHPWGTRLPHAEWALCSFDEARGSGPSRKRRRSVDREKDARAEEDRVMAAKKLQMSAAAIVQLSQELERQRKQHETTMMLMVMVGRHP
mmetsp:Transcript_3675/g.7337  ORF Transcript_3675/g.7337 Transcript_3675/m.7337 type:complete len:306 (-) Transcript_3675:72-989(-)